MKKYIVVCRHPNGQWFYIADTDKESVAIHIRNARMTYAPGFQHIVVDNTDFVRLAILPQRYFKVSSTVVGIVYFANEDLARQYGTPTEGTYNEER